MMGKNMVMLLESDIVDKINGSVTEKALKATTESPSSQDNFMQLIGLILLLVIILVAAYFVSKFVGGIKLGQYKNSNFKVIDTYQIAPNRTMQIVKIANKYIVISIGKDTVNYITELDEPEVLLKDTPIGEKPNFKQIFEKLRMNNK
ncbi:MAG: flagellar biosynthetic protein FliO [Mobilitalea sp.]